MASKTKKVSAETAQRNRQVIHKLREKEHWMKWIIALAILLILLLLLLLGYATDWTTGLRKSNVSAEGGTYSNSGGTDQMPAAGTGSDAGTGGNSANTPGTNTTGGGTTSTGTSTSGGTQTTDRTTTTNTSTTTNNTTPGSTNRLVELYNAIDPGGNIDDAINRANQLGIGVTCTENLIIKECVFRLGDSQIETKSLLGTGTITSVLEDINL